MVFFKEFVENITYEKNQQTKKKDAFPCMQKVLTVCLKDYV